MKKSYSERIRMSRSYMGCSKSKIDKEIKRLVSQHNRYFYVLVEPKEGKSIHQLENDLRSQIGCPRKPKNNQKPFCSFFPIMEDKLLVIGTKEIKQHFSSVFDIRENPVKIL